MESLRKSYTELLRFRSFDERFEYLSLKGQVGQATFGFERWMNQSFYTSTQWRNLRHEIIVRDEGNDLAMDGYEIFDRIIIHHINPLTPDDFEQGHPGILDPENLITTTHNTHNAIHFGDASLLAQPEVERRPGDTIPWR